MTALAARLREFCVYDADTPIREHTVKVDVPDWLVHQVADALDAAELHLRHQCECETSEAGYSSGPHDWTVGDEVKP